MSLDNLLRINGKNNCPNCGAPIGNDECLYCGTRFVDISCIPMDEPFYLKIRKKDKYTDNIHVVKAMLSRMTIDIDTPTEKLYADDAPVVIMRDTIGEINMTFYIL